MLNLAWQLREAGIGRVSSNSNPFERLDLEFTGLEPMQCWIFHDAPRWLLRLEFTEYGGLDAAEERETRNAVWACVAKVHPAGSSLSLTTHGHSRVRRRAWPV